MGSSHLSPIRIPIYTPHKVRVSITFVFHHPERKRVIASTILSFPLNVCQEQDWVIERKIVGLQDFQQLQGCFQHLEFNVWKHPNLKVREHPNLKVSTLILKDQFLNKIDIASIS